MKLRSEHFIYESVCLVPNPFGHLMFGEQFWEGGFFLSVKEECVVVRKQGVTSWQRAFFGGGAEERAEEHVCERVEPASHCNHVAINYSGVSHVDVAACRHCLRES